MIQVFDHSCSVMVVPNQEKTEWVGKSRLASLSRHLDLLIQISTICFMIQIYDHSCVVVVVPNQEKMKWVGQSRLASLSGQLDWLIQHIDMVFYNSSIRSNLWPGGSS